MLGEEVSATSTEMLDKTYGHLYESEAVLASQAMRKAAVFKNILRYVS